MEIEIPFAVLLVSKPDAIDDPSKASYRYEAIKKRPGTRIPLIYRVPELRFPYFNNPRATPKKSLNSSLWITSPISLRKSAMLIALSSSFLIPETEARKE